MEFNFMPHDFRKCFPWMANENWDNDAMNVTEM